MSKFLPASICWLCSWLLLLLLVPVASSVTVHKWVRQCWEVLFECVCVCELVMLSSVGMSLCDAVCSRELITDDHNARFRNKPRFKRVHLSLRFILRALSLWTGHADIIRVARVLTDGPRRGSDDGVFSCVFRAKSNHGTKVTTIRWISRSEVSRVRWDRGRSACSGTSCCGC